MEICRCYCSRLLLAIRSVTLIVNTYPRAKLTTTDIQMFTERLFPGVKFDLESTRGEFCSIASLRSSFERLATTSCLFHSVSSQFDCVHVVCAIRMPYGEIYSIRMPHESARSARSEILCIFRTLQ